MIKLNFNKKSWEICPEFTGNAKIVDYTELRTQTSAQYGDKEVFSFILEIPVKNSKGKQFTVFSRSFTPSLNDKANLRKAFIDKIRGSALTEAELEAFDIESLVGQYCSIVVEHNKVGDKTYANVTYVSKPKDVVPWESEYVRIQDRDGMPERVVKGPVVEQEIADEEYESIISGKQ